jgi:hypothetical protein
MVSINLMPEMLLEAQRVRRRTRKLVMILAAVALVGGGFMGVEWVIRCVRGDPREDVRALAAELQSLRGVLHARRLEAGKKDMQFHSIQSAQATKKRVAQCLLGLPDFIPPHITLSSLHITEEQVVLTGVAGVRSDVGALVGALKSKGIAEDVWIERLQETSIEKYVFQDFVIKARHDASRSSRSGLVDLGDSRDAIVESPR